MSERNDERPKKGPLDGATVDTTLRDVKVHLPLDLEDFERPIELRQTRPSDIDAIIEMEGLCFPGIPSSERENLQSQLAHFPEGQMVIEVEGRLAAMGSSLIVRYADYSAWHDWTRIADDGNIRNHDPEGDTLYGIEMMVHPDFRGMRLSRRLYEARKELVRRMNLKRIIIGGRIPGYHRYASKMNAREYVEYVDGKDLYDPVLTPQLSNGFVLRGLIPAYLDSDHESMGYATHLEWTNLDYLPEGNKVHARASSVRVCAVQWEMRPITSFEAFAEQVEHYVDNASDYRADFILFPELFTLSLLSLVEAKGPGEAARQLAELTTPYLELFADLALRYHINIVGGSQLTLEDDHLFNIAYLFRRDGSIEKQYKLHITPNERRWWGVSPGAKVEVFDTDAGRIAINVCYDVEFPELARYAAAQGARILFVPYNTDEPNGHHRVRTCAKARCIENHLYAVLAGCIGGLPNIQHADTHYAQSAILTPCDIPFARNGVAAEASANLGQVLFYDLDLERVRRHRLDGTTQNFRDRRTDLYRCVFTNPNGMQEEI